MAKFYSELTPKLQEFIAQQQMFFIATAPGREGRVNLSPKGIASLHCLDSNRVAYLDFGGSGNETAAHIADNGRVTIMFCSFGPEPLILRLYGQGTVIQPHQAAWPELSARFNPVEGARQIILLEINSAQTSCGFGVPQYEFVGQRDDLLRWNKKQGPAKLAKYRREHNLVSIDGLPTGLCI
jgi:hypothetical protein